MRPRLPFVEAWRKLDAVTVQITTKSVDALLFYQMLWLLVSSSAQYAKVESWEKFAAEPSGTGLFRMGALQPRVKVELLRNAQYGNPKRIPKAAKLTLACVPEDLSRTSSLLTNHVDLIETPAADAVAQLQRSGARTVRTLRRTCGTTACPRSRAARGGTCRCGRRRTSPLIKVQWCSSCAAWPSPLPGRWTRPASCSEARSYRSSMTWMWHDHLRQQRAEAVHAHD